MHVWFFIGKVFGPEHYVAEVVCELLCEEGRFVLGRVDFELVGAGVEISFEERAIRSCHREPRASRAFAPFIDGVADFVLDVGAGASAEEDGVLGRGVAEPYDVPGAGGFPGDARVPKNSGWAYLDPSSADGLAASVAHFGLVGEQGGIECDV